MIKIKGLIEFYCVDFLYLLRCLAIHYVMKQNGFCCPGYHDYIREKRGKSLCGAVVL